MRSMIPNYIICASNQSVQLQCKYVPKGRFNISIIFTSCLVSRMFLGACFCKSGGPKIATHKFVQPPITDCCSRKKLYGAKFHLPFSHFACNSVRCIPMTLRRPISIWVMELMDILLPPNVLSSAVTGGS